MLTAAKTTTYAVMHIIVAFVIAWWVSDDIKIAIGISLLEPFFQVAAFSLHEHIWSKYHPKAPEAHQFCCKPAHSWVVRLLQKFKK